MRRSLASLGLGAALVVFGALPASAAPLERVHYFDTFTLQVDRCGTVWSGVVTREGVFLLTAGRAGDPTPYALDNYVQTVVWTDTNDPTRIYTVLLQAMLKDLRITHVEGTIYQYEALEVGQWLGAEGVTDRKSPRPGLVRPSGR